MSQLIALIIAIALGAIVTAIGYVFLGDAFTSNSERGVALQLVNQGSQVEMAMTAFRATNAGSAFVNDWDLTRNNDGAGAVGDTNGLEAEGFLKPGILAPQAAYTLVADSDSNVYLVAQGSDLSADVCGEIQDLATGVDTVSEVEFTAIATGDEVEGALDGNRYGCFQDTTTTTEHVFAYQVE